MSEAGRLARGKANFEAGTFLDNPETIDYVNSMKAEEPKKEKKNDKRK